MTTLRYGELFAGAGGMSLGLHRAGLECAFHAEIADFPRRVLSHRWPDTPLYGDVSTLDGRQLVRDHGPIDLLAGGSPCQDLSVAGKRLGLSGARSSLFFEQLRLWEETGATYLLWENVAGALSSNKGSDFAAVLSAIVGADVPVQPKGWRVAGVAAGPAGVAAWRLLDAQWFGVPQRRLRVFVLGARAGGVDPAAVLLEPEGVRWDPPTRGEARKGTSGRSRTGAFYAGNGAKARGVAWTDEGAPSLKAEASGNNQVPSVLAFHQTQDPISDSERSPALGCTSIGMGVLAFSAKDSGADAAMELAPTLRAGGHTTSHENGGVMPAVIAFDTTQITHPENRSNPQPGDPCHPLAAAGHAPTVIAARMVAFGEYVEGGTASAIKARDYKDATDLIVNALRHTTHPTSRAGEGEVIVGTLDSREKGGGSDGAMAGHVQATAGIPRRLMPIECERLMGWPDRWTDIPDEKGKPASDAVRYKACGNGVVSHVPEWIARRLLAVVTATSTTRFSAAA